MNTYIALLRGINVSGEKKVLMAELRTLLESQGLENVKTYIQSGNVVFQSSVKDVLLLENLVFNSITKHFGFEAPVVIITVRELQIILESCPFLEEKIKTSYFTLLKTTPEKQLFKEFSSLEITNEEIIVTNKCVYFYSENGYGKAKCNTNFIEKKLKVSATTRNYKTMIKLINLGTAI